MKKLRYQPAEPSDFETLAELRTDAMRESLEAIGRFNRERSFERFRATFSQPNTEKVMVGSELVGFYALIEHDDHLSLDHLYVSPRHQSQGIGSAIVARVLERSRASGLTVKLGALKDSQSNTFYRKHGFVQQSEDEWDIYYARPADPADGEQVSDAERD